MSIRQVSTRRGSPQVSSPEVEDTDTRLATRILSEFREMPGLCLTVSQAARLWGLDIDRCLRLLQVLVAAGRLRCLPRGRYALPGGDSDGRQR